jgi:endonuclease/exonuclease/phosphatase family metal-dependent hydrolase
MQFQVMTWNLENLFPSTTDVSEKSVYQRKLALIAETIASLEPDVVGLQEIGSPEALSDVQRALRRNYRHHAISNHPDPRGIRVAFLSRLSIDEVEQIAGAAPKDEEIRPWFSSTSVPQPKMRRGALRIRVAAARRHVSLINVHLKSKLLSYPGPGGTTVFTTEDEDLRARVAAHALATRADEAVILRNVATARLASAPRESLVMLGDFNDTPDAATSQILLGPPGSQPGSRGFDLPDGGDGARLFNVANFIAAERRYSRVTSGVPELIDHILVSEHLLPRGSDRRRHVPLVDAHVDRFGRPSSVGQNPRAREAEIVPDHAPVTAEFALRR